MRDLPTTVLWIYIILLLVGGLMGFLKAKSKVSLITSSIAATLLILAALPGILDRTFARNLVNVVMALLIIVFTIRLTKTKKFMPSGMLLVVTIIALALRNIRF
ncbi:MAG TPA: TMEM14 family protein [Desulfuromonadaceae bacterium]|nr:TMEM14 family protein [Desulfuromonadaceae bacterium]